MPLSHHFKETFELKKTHASLQKTLLAGISIPAPLIIGYFSNHFAFSMFGSLFNLILYLNDHFGPLQKRINHLIITSIFLFISILIGINLIKQTAILSVILFVLAFGLGKIKNKGAELEKLVLFSILYIITMAETPALKHNLVLPVVYSVIGFILYLLCMFIIDLLKKEIPSEISSKSDAFKKHILKNDSNSFSLFYASICTFSYLMGTFLHLNRVYWITGTVLIVMLPDTHQSIYKGIQRLVGTLVGVLLACLIYEIFNGQITLLFLIFLFSLLTPTALAKNYWLGNVTIAALIMFFLETSTSHHTIWGLSYMRTIDIGIGSSLAAISIAIFNYFYKKQTSNN